MPVECAQMARGDLISQALRRVWGFESLRPTQQAVVDAALDGRDAVVVMPTGGGKSLCFQLPAVVESSLTVVVSPLIALMKDQVDALRLVGVGAAALNSSLTPDEEATVSSEIVGGKIQVLYLSPERLLLQPTLALLAKADRGKGVCRVAVDEAHCISGWGHDFRPEYRQLGRLREWFPGVPIMAFTATATPKVQKDIAIQLGLTRPKLFVGVFDRPNLTYRVVAKSDTAGRIAEAVARFPDEGVIVYCLSRKDTESTVALLTARGVSAVAYHAGLSAGARKKVSEDFAQERVNVVVATVAFGMGIDRSNVRCVIHECLPKSMEGYQQETGRAGRDGVASECLLLYSLGDVSRLRRLLSDGGEMAAHNLRLLDEVQRFVTSNRCRHKAVSEHFGQSYESAEQGCGACDVCLGGTRLLENGAEVAHAVIRAAAALSDSGRAYGVGTLVAILRGSRAKAVVERGGERVSGFGRFASESAGRVTAWVHQLVEQGLLVVAGDKYPVVEVSPRARECVEQGHAVVMVENTALAEPTGGSTRSGLFEALRAWRRQVAAERSVPAYVILHDQTLHRIAEAKPDSGVALAEIPGLGEKRAADFGDDLLRVVRSHAQPAAIQRPAANIAEYARLFDQGLSVPAVAAQLSKTEGTVWEHLSVWVEANRPDSISTWVDEEAVGAVGAAIAAVEGDRLKPVFEHLGGKVPYGIIRVVKSFRSVRT